MGSRSSLHEDFVRVKTLMGLEPFEVRFFVEQKFTKFDLALKWLMRNFLKLVQSLLMIRGGISILYHCSISAFQNSPPANPKNCPRTKISLPFFSILLSLAHYDNLDCIYGYRKSCEWRSDFHNTSQLTNFLKEHFFAASWFKLQFSKN